MPKPVFGWKARVPLPRTLRPHRGRSALGSLLVEAKLTEVRLSIARGAIVESYRDFDEVFDRDLLPRIEIPLPGAKQASEIP